MSDLELTLRATFAAEAEELTAAAVHALLELERSPEPAAAARAWSELAHALHTLKGSAATVGLEDASQLVHRMEDVLAARRREGLGARHFDAFLPALDAVLETARAASADRTPPALAPHLAGLDALVSEAAIAPAPAESAPQPAAAAAASEEQGGWRVRSQDLSALLQSVEQLRSVRARLAARRAILERATAHADEDHGRLVNDLGLSIDGIDDAIEGLLETVKTIGTLPVQTLVDPLRRAVREVARELGRSARLEVRGRDLAIDRRLLGALRGPLLHLVRNAVVHGLEAPDVRERAGKSPEGLVILSFEAQGGSLRVAVEDDGAGLDPAKLREAARRAGRDVAGLGPEALAELVFDAGISTAGSTTNAAGRGIGLDAARTQIVAAGGTLEVEQRPGQGARFVATVALELGSTPVLVVRVGEHRLAIPATAVHSLAWVRDSELTGGAGRPTVVRGGQLVEVRSAAALLGIGGERVDAPVRLVVRLGAEGAFALTVDEALGDDEVIVRPLPPELRHLDAYVGVALLGSEALLVLRPDGLVARLAEVRELPSSLRALVVDDSLTARALHRAVLEAGGFTVHATGSADHALEQLGTGRYDVVVCDVAMEGMDGCTLTRRLRARPDTRGLPVVLVSAHDAEADRRRGLEAGADAYVGKRECASGRLLAEVNDVVARRRSRA